MFYFVVVKLTKLTSRRTIFTLRRTIQGRLVINICIIFSKLSLKDPENTALSKTALEIYLKFNKYCEAMFVALQLNEDELIEDIFTKCSDLSMRKQLSYILGRQQRFLELGEDIAEAEELQGRIKNFFSRSKIS